MIETAQDYATLSGLLMDMAGVFILAREFKEFLGGGTRQLLATHVRLNLKLSEQAREARAKSEQAVAAGAGWLTILNHDLGLTLRRGYARLYGEQVKRQREKAGLPPRSVIGPDGFWDDAQIAENGRELDSHYGELAQTGELRSGLARIAFYLIVGGFALQFVGALPL